MKKFSNYFLFLSSTAYGANKYHYTAEISSTEKGSNASSLFSTPNLKNKYYPKMLRLFYPQVQSSLAVYFTYLTWPLIPPSPSLTNKFLMKRRFSIKP
mmetsp:Transcript_22616/g.40243  ORF Transcript_22616/g.40243 Transcript_22616/m.40243 type:complete len:98 (+) Transcript_22616:719-1012(+)